MLYVVSKKPNAVFRIILLILIIFVFPVNTRANTATIGASPNARIDYSYSSGVSCGTIRYITQRSGSGYFNYSYWGGWAGQAGIECGTASISMALSYIGINKTPKDILDAHNGETWFGYSWDGVAYSNPSISTGINNFVNGNGKYSPVIVHFPKGTYSADGHYVILAGKESDSSFTVVDPARDSTWTLSTSNSWYSAIDQTFQYFNPNGIINYDNTPPTIEDVYIHDIDKNGYYVHCIVRDDTALSRLEFPTWTSNTNASGNSQDDLTWDKIAIGGTAWEYDYRVDYSRHNNETDCTYWTDIYCADAAGNGLAQSFYRVSHYPHNGSEMSSGYDRVLPDGDYLIATAGTTDKSSFYYMDIEGSAVPAPVGKNVSLCGPATNIGEYDIWTITYANGFYTIKQKGTEMALDIENTDGNAIASGRNVTISNCHYGPNQQFAISQSGDVGYRIQAKCSGCSIDVAGGNISNGINIQQYANNNELAQKWLFIPYNPVQSIDEGRYILLPSASTGMELDVSGDTGEVGNGINVQIWNDGAASQYNSFELVKLSNGYYKFVHAASGKCLDVGGGSVTSSGNINLYDDNGSIAQQWAVIPNGNGYAVIARCSGYALDVWGDATEDGTNVAQGYFHGGANQTWDFVPAEYSVTYDVNGGTDAPATQTKYYKTDLTLKTVEPTRDDYLFIGWTTNPNATIPDYNPGDTYTKDEDVTLYALWEAECDHQIVYSIVEEPALSTSGKISGTCSICGKDKEIILPALNENDYQYSVKKASTCRNEGVALYVWKVANGQTFEFEAPIATISHDYHATQNPPSCIDNGSITYTCSMCGDSYTERTPISEPSGSDGWSTEKPTGVLEDMIYSKTQYRYRDLQTTTSTSSSLAGWTQTGSSTSYGNYGAWSGWSETAQSGSDTRQVETRQEYRYYYFYCPVCGGHEPLQGISDCHQYTLSLSDGVVGWFPTPFSDCNPQSYSYTSAKKWTTSLGDGQRWNLSTADIGHTDVGYQGDAGTPIIRLVYRYRDRSKTITYSYEKWGDWSEWSDTKYTASSSREVETRTVYKYDADRDNRHQWGAPSCEYDETAKTLTLTYTCTLNAEHTKTEVIENVHTMKLPAQLKEIEEEAFAGRPCQVVIIPDGCTTIGSRAFADCDELLYVRIPPSVTEIADDAFEGCDKYLQ